MNTVYLFQPPDTATILNLAVTLRLANGVEIRGDDYFMDDVTIMVFMDGAVVMSVPRDETDIIFVYRHMNALIDKAKLLCRSFVAAHCKAESSHILIHEFGWNHPELEVLNFDLDNHQLFMFAVQTYTSSDLREAFLENITPTLKDLYDLFYDVVSKTFPNPYK